MAQYTVLDTASIATILEAYSIGELKGYQTLTGGLENTNYQIQTTTGDFVLTLCEQKQEIDAINLARLLNHLNDNGLNTTKVFTTQKGTWTTTYKSKPILLKSYITGGITPHLVNEQMVALGRELATLHSIPTLPFVPTQLGYGIAHFDKVLDHPPTTPFCDWLLETKAYIESFFSPTLPKALLHSDLFFNNVIVDPSINSLSIIDFEEAAYYYRIYDIGMTLMGVCSFNGQLNLELSKHLLHGYQKQVKLTEIEKNALQAFTIYAATATAFWRYMNFNFVRPDEVQKDLYKEMQALASGVRNISPAIFRSILG